jgi:hypothetical protein
MIDPFYSVLATVDRRYLEPSSAESAASIEG